MDKLLELLNKLNNRPVSEIKNRQYSTGEYWLTNGEPDRPDEMVQEIVNEASRELITKDGQADFDKHEILKDHGFRISCGERDSFGWLSGCIHTAHGIIVYG